MAEYKLSFTGSEIDEKLKKIEDGGTGYTEGETIHPIDPKYLPSINLDDYGIDLGTLVTNGGGTQIVDDADKAQAFYNDIANIQPIYAFCNVLGSELKCIINVLHGSGISFSLAQYYLSANTMFDAKVSTTLVRNADDEIICIQVHAIVQTTVVPT